jgi:predicted RecB family nuclease
MAERLLTPSKITAWLDCAHYLTLKHEVDTKVREHPPSMFGEMAQMLLEKGQEHEQAVLDRYRADGREVCEVPQRAEHESFAAWVERVANVLLVGHDVIYQMPFVHGGVRGIADFLERVDLPDGRFTYEPVDAKLARKEAKPGHVLQLCFYAEAIADRLGTAPEQMHLELGSGARETVRVDDVAAYWRRLRGRLADLVAEPGGPTTPEKCDHCGFCEFELVCDAEWRAADSLIHVAGVRTVDRHVLEADEVDTIAGLAALDRSVDELDPVRLERFVRQASLQVQARAAPEGTAPPFELLDSATQETEPDDDAPADAQPDPSTLTGFAALPAPDDGDVFLDFEGHPFWRADAELFFLFGLIERDDAGEWQFREFWAHDRDEEKQAVADLVAYLAERRSRFPGMHVYHYNHTERSALQRLTREHGVAELELERQVATGMFVDLFRVVTGAMQVGVESYGLKYIELLTDFERGHEIDRGAGAVIEYEHYMRDRDGEHLTRIARYNEDDVRATRALRDWLVTHRPDGGSWRPAVIEPLEPDVELDERIEALHAFGPGTPEHLMGDLLGYWRREKSVVAADCLRLSMAPDDDQFDSLDAIARLSFIGSEPRLGKNGKPLTSDLATFQFPPQPVSPEIRKGSKLIQAIDERSWAFFDVVDIDAESGELQVLWSIEHADAGWFPTSLVHYVWFRESPKPEALCELADQMLTGSATSVAHAILRRDPSRFLPGTGPAGGRFVGGYEAICEWAPHLDRSYVPVQGPPGTGKTFTGAHVVRALVRQGKRIGITAMSHQAIDNQMQAVVDRFTDDGDLPLLQAVRKNENGPVTGVTYQNDPKKCATGDFNVIAGTPWLFANQAMRDNPVDVLIVDEAGQLGLADTLAAAVSARNVILLGDPQQLPQVAQASHPDGSGASALEHLLGPGVRTFPDDRGVLLDTTWRMHPDVCDFISDVMYDGKLASHESCHGQTTVAGTGLRWIRAEHDGNSTESPEEAAIVAATIERLIGTNWTDQKSNVRPITTSDVIVVTPYNDQRRLIERTLTANPIAASVEVGTVDMFQGREAAVVVFSMATSSAEFMPRQADFLFSKNRLNVAISRARCLAYLICTDELLDTRARDVEEMTLISALCAFVERAELDLPDGSTDRRPHRSHQVACRSLGDHQ